MSSNELRADDRALISKKPAPSSMADNNSNNNNDDDDDNTNNNAPEASDQAKGYLIALVRIGEHIRVYGSSVDRDDCDEILDINGTSIVGKTIANHKEIVDHVRQCIKLRNIQVRIKRNNNHSNYGDNINQNRSTFQGLSLPKGAPASDEQGRTEANRIACRSACPRILKTGATEDKFRDEDLPTSQARQEILSLNQQQQQQHQQQDSNRQQLGAKAILLDVFVIGSNAQFQLERFFRLTNIHPHSRNNLKLILSTSNGSGGGPNQEEDINLDQDTNLKRAPSSPESPLPTAANTITTNTSKTITTTSTGSNIIAQDNRMLDKSDQNNSMAASQLDKSAPRCGAPGELSKLKEGEEFRNKEGQENELADPNDSIITHELAGILDRLSNGPDKLLSDTFRELCREARLDKLLAIYRKILTSCHERNLSAPLSDIPLSELLSNIFQILQINRSNQEEAELLSILCRYEMEGACKTYDQIISTCRESIVVGSRVRSPNKLPDDFSNNNNNNNNNQATKQPDQQQQLAPTQKRPIEEDSGATPSATKQKSSKRPIITSELVTGSEPNRKIVHIDKSSNKALGATIKNDGKRVIIGRIVHGGLAQKSGLLNEGDEILEVNGISMLNKNIDQVVDLIQAMDGTLTLTIKCCTNQVNNNQLSDTSIAHSGGPDSAKVDHLSHQPEDRLVQRNGPFNSTCQEKIFVRAFFDFDGQRDEQIPCKELALSFRKGEILSIFDRSDKTWWQAKRQLDDHEPNPNHSAASQLDSIDTEDDEEDDQFTLAGLIPSLEYLTQQASKTRQLSSSSIGMDQDDASEIRISSLYDLLKNHYNSYNSEIVSAMDQSSSSELINGYKQNNEDDYYDDQENLNNNNSKKSNNLVLKLFQCPTNVQMSNSGNSHHKRPNNDQSTNHHHWPIKETSKTHLNQCNSINNLNNNNNNHHYLQLFQAIDNQIPFYEQVQLYYPMKSSSAAVQRRPIILVGPKMIGRRELLDRLVREHPTRFKCPISHTTRPRRSNERDGIDFHFVTLDKFESDIKRGLFIESGQYQNQYYGTSSESIKSIMMAGKTCVHMINIPSLFKFRHSKAGSELKPFFVFVRPDIGQPSKLRHLVSSHCGGASSKNGPRLDELINGILLEVKLVESHLLAFFDLVINITPDIDRACRELLPELDRIEHEPQWVPKFWSE